MKGFPYISDVMGEIDSISSEDSPSWILDLPNYVEGYKGKESVK
jgi:hypothetical protein